MKPKKKRLLILENGETPLPLKVLSRRVPGNPHYETVRQWCKQGRRNSEKQLIRLECVLLPSGLCSSEAAFWRFIAKLNEE